MLSSRVFFASLIFILCMFMIYTFKPYFLFDAEGELKQFGVNPTETIYSLGVISCALAVFLFYIVSLKDLIYT